MIKDTGVITEGKYEGEGEGSVGDSYKLRCCRPAIILPRPDDICPGDLPAQLKIKNIFPTSIIWGGNKTDNMTSCLYFQINQIRRKSAAMPPGC